MFDGLVCLAAGLIGGGCIGFVLGREAPRLCRECLSQGSARYRAGYQTGWADATARMSAAVRERGIRAKNTWTITHEALDRAERDVLDIGG